MRLALGPFDMIEFHAQGGMAEVWRGVHRRTAKPVAIKVMNRVAARPVEWRLRFAREIRSAARLEHPAVVRVFDHGVVGASLADRSAGNLNVGAPYLIMEWLGGGPLERGLAARRWPALKTAATAVLSGLAHAHARDVVHRDIKPDNVLLGDRGPVLTDFGLALDPQYAAGSAQAAGTPGYMAPEQIANDWHLFGPATDLYALGCLVWALATGRAPHEHPRRPPLAIAMAHLKDPLPPFDPRFAVPDGLQPWLRRMLARSPAGRFHSAAEALAALEAWTTGGSTRPPTVPPLGIPDDWTPAASATADDLLGAGQALLGHRVPPPVGREAQRDRLWAALRGLVSGAGLEVLCVAGASGQGKTHLADWLAEQAHQLGVARVLRATHEHPNGPSCGLGPMLARAVGAGPAPPADASPARLAAHRRRLREAIDAFMPAGLSPFERAEALALLAPDGRAEIDDVRVSLRSLLDWDLAFGLALRHLGADRPTLIVVDDLQWGPAAQRTLAQLRQVALDASVLVLATVSTDVGPSADTALDRFPDEAIIRLGPLAPDAHRRLLARTLPLDPRLRDALVERADGSPLFAAELMRQWVGAGLLVEGPRGYRLAAGAHEALPESVETLWTTRLENALGTLIIDARDALELGAVIGLVVEADFWNEACAYAGVPWPAEAIGHLLDAGLMRELEGGRYRFVHAMLRETLQRWTHNGGRWLAWNAGCARVMAERQARGAPIDRARLARHLIDAEEHREAVRPLAAATEAAMARGDTQAWEELLALRLRTLRRIRVRRDDPRWLSLSIDAARLGERRGDYRRAQARLARALRSPTLAAHPKLHCQALYVLSTTYLRLEGPEHALPIIEHALPIAEASGDVKEHVWLLGAYAPLATTLGRLDSAEAALQRGLELLSPIDHEHFGVLYYYVAHVAAYRGRIDDALDGCRRARAAFTEAGRQHNAALTWGTEGDLHRRAGRLDEAADAYARHAARPHIIGPAARCYVALNEGMLAVARGAWADGLASLDRAAAEGIRSPEAIIAAATLCCAAGARDRIMWDATASALAGMLDDAPVSPDVPWAADCAASLAEAAGWPRRAAFARQVAADHRRRIGTRRPTAPFTTISPR